MALRWLHRAILSDIGCLRLVLPSNANRHVAAGTANLLFRFQHEAESSSSMKQLCPKHTRECDFVRLRLPSLVQERALSLRCDPGAVTPGPLLGEVDDRRVCGNSVVPHDDGARLPDDSGLEVSPCGRAGERASEVS